MKIIPEISVPCNENRAVFIWLARRAKGALSNPLLCAMIETKCPHVLSTSPAVQAFVNSSTEVWLTNFKYLPCSISSAKMSIRTDLIPPEAKKKN